MGLQVIIAAAGLMLGLVVCYKLFVAWGTGWGATPEECARPLTGDAYLAGGPERRVTMTRAISLSRPPGLVWPWLAQIGRGAGWYSYDRLDNGGKASARHLVSWIPEPQPGDATVIGYLRHLDPGRELVWWVDGEKWLGATVRLVIDLLLAPEGAGSLLVIRISGDAAGPTARLAIGVFQVIDTIMARRQLLGIKERVEKYGARTVDPELPENGRLDQYQSFAVIYASGATAGRRDREKAALWRQMAVKDGVLINPPPVKGGTT